MDVNLSEKGSIVKWKDTFGSDPVRILPETQPLQKEWKTMGEAYGMIQLEKQKYIRAGLTEAAKEIENKLVDKKNDLESRTIDLLGYPRISESAKRELEQAAQKDSLFLNTYALEEYKMIPPPNIAMAIMEARQYFNKIEIWAIEEKAYVRPMKDPAVIGYVKIGYKEVPYLIATWGDDIKPEDLVEINKKTDVVETKKSLPST